MGYKVLFWRESWWGYPKAHQGSRMVPQKPSGVISKESDTGEDGVKVRMGGHVQILGLPTHPNPIIFLAIWSSLGETIRKKKKKNREKIDSFSHPIWSSSLLAPKSGLAQKRPYVDAERGVIYSPLLPWKNLGLTGFGNQDRAKIGAALSWGSAQPWNRWVALPSTPP